MGKESRRSRTQTHPYSPGDSDTSAHKSSSKSAKSKSKATKSKSESDEVLALREELAEMKRNQSASKPKSGHVLPRSTSKLETTKVKVDKVSVAHHATEYFRNVKFVDSKEQLHDVHCAKLCELLGLDADELPAFASQHASLVNDAITKKRTAFRPG
jgi:ribonuclease D